MHGAPGATLTVSSGPGNTLLDQPCAGLLSRDIELQPAPVSVRLVAAGEGYQKAATGVVRVYEAASLAPGPR